MGGKVDPLGIVQEIKILLYYPKVDAQNRILPQELDT